MAEYRAGVIGLGWMGLLSDLGRRPPDRYAVEDVERPTPPLDVHAEVRVPHSWAEALRQRPGVELAAGAERDPRRLEIFRQRYGLETVYTDAAEMLRSEGLDIVVVATNTRGRADLACLAVECGARAIAVEKPLAHTLEEADRMVSACAAAGVPLCAGAIPVNHPSYGAAKGLLHDGTIGEVLSIEAPGPAAQKPHWALFVDGRPAWVAGCGDGGRRESGSDEFTGQGMMATAAGQVVFFRGGAPLVRVTGTAGEIRLDPCWRLWRDLDTESARQRVEVPWPGPQLEPGRNAVCGLSDLIDCLEGRLEEPRNSGRRMATALEVEIGLKLSSARGGERVELPLEDRSLGLRYDWFR